MSHFIIIASLITLVCIVLLVRPLLRSRNPISYERNTQNIHFARARLDELETQLKNATISATDYEALKLEIENTLADDIDISQQENKKNIAAPNTSIKHSHNKRLILSLFVLFPAVAGGMYYMFGTPETFDTTRASLNSPAGSMPSAEEIDQMLISIEQRLEANPEDPEGWAILSRSYLATGRYQEAKRGFLKLIEYGGESATAYAQLADISAIMAGGVIAGEPMQYVNQSLNLDPEQPQALWMAGLNAVQSNQPEIARRYWNTLLPLLAQAPEQQSQLRSIIQETFASPESGLSNTETQTPSSEPVVSEAKLSVTVTIDPLMRDQVTANDIVFIFARAQNGPPAPLAVKRLQVKDLPSTVTLDDDDAMMPQLKLSLFDNVQITARVSKSGDPIAQPGDVQSNTVLSKNVSKEPVKLNIAERVN